MVKGYAMKVLEILWKV